MTNYYIELIIRFFSSSNSKLFYHPKYKNIKKFKSFIKLLKIIFTCLLKLKFNLNTYKFLDIKIFINIT